ncbi:AfsR/SARP family transcriptional regulator [Hamadaea tsunoensis]|uniref:AfsR/SARP family transcriptional regulator n=1 Tax=Hamadaea tsunoensis TaxID=53368 RepID=UPI0003F4AE8F|nr:BTAD domain-containing putative transcriptional regulator [Hamadaea tsunoensis]
MSRTRFGVLGPVRITGPAGTAELVGRVQRTLAGLLVLHAGSVVSSDRLTDALWGDDPPRTALRSLHSHVSRIRQAFERAGLPDVLLTREPGYLLRVPAAEVDVYAFEEAVRLACEQREAGDVARAAGTLTAGLALWRGDVLADAAVRDWAEAEVVRLRELRLRAYEEMWADRLTLGEHGPAVPELERLTAAEPARERLVELLMLALNRSGRRADALDRYQQLRVRLADEVGIDPDPRLRALHARILRGEERGAETVERPLRTAVVPAQLPPPVGHFTGRDGELDRLDRWAAAGGTDQRVVIICGPPGIGKTALAAQWTRRVAAGFPDGQIFLDLRGEDPDASLTPGDALAAVLRVLGVPADRMPVTHGEQLGLYRTLLADRRTLLLLDDAGTADHVLPLVPPGPASLLVVTTRRRLTALGAHHEVHQVELDALPADASAALLRRVLGEQRVAQEPDAARRLAELCAGMPLALRLAAARLAARPRRLIVDLVADLSGDDRLDLLAADGDSRSVRKVLTTVYDSLSEPAARLFRLAGLHPGRTVGAGLTAALAGRGAGHARRDLDELASAHLLTEVSSGRYAMHDLIRVYATELSTQDAEADREATGRRLLDWYRHLVYAANAVLDPARDRVPAPGGEFTAPFAATPEAVLAYLDGEHANLVPVIAYAARTGHADHAWQMAYLVAGYFESRGRTGDRVEVYQRGYAAVAGRGDRVAEGLMLSGLGVACTAAHRYEEALVHLRAALGVLTETGDQRGLGHVHNNIAAALGRLHRYDAAIEACERALAVHTAAGHRLGMLLAHNNLGHLHARVGRTADSLAHLEQGLAIADADGDLRLASAVWHGLGETHAIRGDDDAARDCFERALELRRTTGNRRYQAGTLGQLGTIALRQHRSGDAVALFTEQCAISRDLADEHLLATALTNLAAANMAGGDLGTAGRLLDEALALRARVPDAFEYATTLRTAGDLERRRSDLDGAKARWSAAAALFR